MKVYLAGPIAGLYYTGATNWREDAIKALAPIRGMSPMRGKEYLKDIGPISGHGREYAHLNVMSSPRGVMTRDRYDATTYDVLLVNFIGAKKPSIGTCMEIAWADANRIPIVCAMEPFGNPHDHMMITEALGYRVESLDEAIRLTRILLLGSN